jgi:ATP synthase I chain
MRLRHIPTIDAIQRTTAIATVVTAAIMLVVASPGAALGCLIGGALMIANLYAFSLIGRSMLALAQQRGGASAVGLMAAPLKMFALAAIVFLVIESGRINVPGFIVGSLTQIAAIFIETWRAARGHTPAEPNQAAGPMVAQNGD